MIKLDLLSTVADETNAFEIATELTEYVNDIDEPLARGAVRAVGRIALEVSPAGFLLSRCRSVHWGICCSASPLHFLLWMRV